MLLHESADVKYCMSLIILSQIKKKCISICTVCNVSAYSYLSVYVCVEHK